MSAMQPYPESVSEAEVSGRPTVLVVDDYPENCRLIYFYLRSDYNVISATSAEEAFDILAQYDVDLVIMDINLKDGMNGVEATKHIRRNPALAHLPILAISAYAYPDDRLRFIEAGFNDYIPKPIFKERILRKVRLLLGDDTGVWVSGPRDPQVD